MGGVTDFVLGGTPAPNVAPTGGRSQLPQYQSDFNMWLANKGNAYYQNATYQTDPYPTVAGPSDLTKKSWDMTSANAGKYTPAVNGALTQVQGLNAPAMHGFDTAAQTVGGGLGRFTGQTVNDYMNPYVNNVVNAANASAMRNYNENVAPSLNAQFISAGQPNSLGHEAQAGRNVRDLTSNMQLNDAALYGQAYDTAQNAFAGDQNRQLTGGMDQAAIAQNRAATGANLADTQANIAKLGQGMGYTDASAMDAAGQEKTGFDQRNVDALTAQWQGQRDFQQNTLNQGAQFANMLNGGASFNSNNPSQYQYDPSPFNAAGMGNAIGMAGWHANRGGLAMARGGLVRPPIPEWLREALEAAA